MSRFSVGEVCEGWVGLEGRWTDVTLIRRDGYYLLGNGAIDPVWITDFTGGKGTGLFSESGLRKKHPPQQDNEKAEDWFIKDLNKLLKQERVKV